MSSHAKPYDNQRSPQRTHVLHGATESLGTAARVIDIDLCQAKVRDA